MRTPNTAQISVWQKVEIWLKKGDMIPKKERLGFLGRKKDRTKERKNTPHQNSAWVPSVSSKNKHIHLIPFHIGLYNLGASFSSL